MTAEMAIEEQKTVSLMAMGSKRRLREQSEAAVKKSGDLALRIKHAFEVSHPSPGAQHAANHRHV